MKTLLILAALIATPAFGDLFTDAARWVTEPCEPTCELVALCGTSSLAAYAAEVRCLTVERRPSSDGHLWLVRECSGIGDKLTETPQEALADIGARFGLSPLEDVSTDCPEPITWARIEKVDGGYLSTYQLERPSANRRDAATNLRGLAVTACLAGS